MRDEMPPPEPDPKRGFAAMPPERVREIARSGGQKAHRMRRAHQWNGDEAKVAGAKGGRKVSSDRAHMAEIGRKGGEAAAKRRAKRAKREDGE